jgi:hypothetical protein
MSSYVKKSGLAGSNFLLAMLAMMVASGEKSQTDPLKIPVLATFSTIRLPVSNPINYVTICYVFSVIHITRSTISLWTSRSKNDFLKILKIILPRSLIFQSIMKLCGCRIVE